MVRRVDANNYDEHKAKRDEHKSAFSNEYISTMLSILIYGLVEKTRYTNPIKQKFKQKRAAAEGLIPHRIILLLNADNDILLVDGAAPAPATKRPNVQMPDEYLPPNKILFLQNLPESVTKDQLLALFAQ